MGDTLWPNFQKFSMSKTTAYIKSPSVGSSFIISWRTTYGTRDMFTEKIAYTLPSDAYYYTSLEFNDI